MTRASIRFEHVHLHYAAVAYQQRSLKALLSRVRIATRPPPVSDIHALDDVTLAIDSGERVGIVGRNGAGKSTLLKTVADLYPISSGRITVQGSVRALFDLSLGFEPDATGRENILYRGLLLGQSPRFMRERAADIVAFADLGQFIDYPIKTYSAGMQVRLAFAISTAIPGEILLLDEVIGAGDMGFMAKAKTRIRDIAGQAEILLVASHDVSTLETLCTRAVWLDRGRVRFDGAPAEAIGRYRADVNTTAAAA